MKSGLERRGFRSEDLDKISFGVKKPQENAAETSKSSIGRHAPKFAGLLQISGRFCC